MNILEKLYMLAKYNKSRFTSLSIKKTTILLLILLSNLLIINKKIFATNNNSLLNTLKANIVKIATTFSDGEQVTGLGFVMCEVDNSLYIVTSLRIVVSDYSDVSTKEIKIKFSNENDFIHAVTIHKDLKLDIALLKVNKPKGYKWNYNYRGIWVSRNDFVWIIKKTDKWDNHSDLSRGQVNQSDTLEIKAEFRREIGGLLGGPLIKNDQVAGIVVNDEGNKVTALTISKVRDRVSKWLKIELVRRLAFPFFLVGLNGGFSAFGSFSSGGSAPFNYGYTLQASFSPKFSFRFDWVSCRLKSKIFRSENQDFQFRNDYNAYSASLLFYSTDYMFYGDYGYYYFGLGYSLVNIDPEISINKGDWNKLKDVEGGEYDYSNRTGSINLFTGLGGFPFSNKVMIGGELGLKLFTTKYLYINPSKLFTESRGIDWIFYFNLKVGFAWRKRKAKTKFLDY